jgi:ABC-type phosphate transport system substrate-binding protein
MSGTRQLQARRRRVAAGFGAALIAAAIMAPAASAQNGFTLNECAGEGILGRGASFQNTAHTTLWNTVTFKASIANGGCGSQAPNVLWDSTGSGNGRAALGARDVLINPNGDRDATVRFAGSDEPPSPLQVQQMQQGVVDANGQDATAADNGTLHVIPVAIGAITVIVNLPKAPGECTVGTDVYDPAPGNNTTRPKITNALLEKAFAGQITTWGDLIPTISGSGCADAPIKRAVRLDSSGSTFAFKDFLSKIDPAPWQSLGNQDWPNNSGATAVVRGGDSGGGALRTTAAATDGSISYLALSDARGGTGSPFVLTPNATTHDDTFWLPIQRQGTATYDDPQSAQTGFTSTSVKGAACTTAPITGAPASTLGDWSKTSAVYTSVGYGICTLTYDLAFDDNAVVYCNSDAEQRKARTVRDYLNKAVLGDAGQAGTAAVPGGLAGQDYDALPTNILTISRAGAAQIGWNKGGQGRPCTTQNQNQDPEVTPTPVPGASPTPTPTIVTPPPAAISNAFTIASARASGTSIRLSLQLPGAGAISVASSTKPKKGSTIKLSTKTVSATKSGAQVVTVSLSSKAKTALKKAKSLKVALKITYTPTGGTAKTLTKTVTVKQPKKKK